MRYRPKRAAAYFATFRGGADFQELAPQLRPLYPPPNTLVSPGPSLIARTLATHVPSASVETSLAILEGTSLGASLVGALGGDMRPA